jgi:hypothetical protein
LKVDTLRIKALIGELSSVDEVPFEEGERFEPNFIYVVDIFDPMKIIIHPYITLTDIIPTPRKASDNSYKYAIKLLDISPKKSVPALAWQGPTSHPRLRELIQYINKFVESIETVYWEEFTAARVRAQLQAIEASEQLYLKWKEEFLNKFWEYYSQNLPSRAKILLALAKEKIEFKVVEGELVCEAPSDIIGHLIGKQGVHAKNLEQILGVRIHFIAKQ